MIFTSSLFLFFLITIFLLRWFFSYKDNSLLVIVLLLSSYLFYAGWRIQFLALILLTTLADFTLGYFIHSSQNRNVKISLLAFSLLINLSVLGFFKYSSFFLDNFYSLFSLFGFSPNRLLLEISLPAGISFYIFQSMSYIIDVYRGIIPAEKKLLNYALYLAFFPQLVAGPIVLAHDFIPQIKNAYWQKFEDVYLKESFYFILLGFLKKSVIADNISIITDFIFATDTNLMTISWQYLLMGVVSYSIQIYCDFSGYTDIARGVALLLGFHLPENFNLPYFASSLTDFWRRWHISLSSWLRSYLYIPLGGNRFGNLITYRNLFITMLLGGLWHGASWNFVLWGALHGVYLAIEKFSMDKLHLKSILSDIRPIQKLLLKILYSLLTYCLVSTLWIFFRAANLGNAISIIKGIATLQAGILPNYTIVSQFYFLLFLVIAGHSFGYFASNKIQKFLTKKDSDFSYALFALLAIIFVLNSGELKPFIYFVF